MNCRCGVLYSVFVDPLHERGDARVDTGVWRQSAPDAPADDTGLDPLRARPVLHDQRATAVTLNTGTDKKKL